jgi:tetratricopeptide (TPR) repeat protein
MSAATTREERARRKRLIQQQAQQLALNGEWAEAIKLNQEVLEATPNDVTALNRLGKAYSELGRYSEAYNAYNQSFEIDPANQIARRNLQRLEPLKNLQADDQAPERRHSQARQTMFIEEIGKTRVTELLKLADTTTLARMTSGDQVELRVEGKQVAVYSEDGLQLGRLEPRLAHRLIALIAGGNRYSAAVTVVEPGLLRIIIRETFQHSSQAGRLSFPVSSKPLTPRAYTRATERLYAADDTDLYGDDDEAEDTDDAEPEEDEEFAETEETLGADEPEEEQTV